MYHINAYIPDRHGNDIKVLKEQTELSNSELLRRILDYSLKEDRLNEIIPSMSGKIKIGQ